jgi:hypothetical protein
VQSSDSREDHRLRTLSAVVAVLGFAVAGGCSAPADGDLGVPPSTTAPGSGSDADGPDEGSGATSPPPTPAPDTSSPAPGDDGDVPDPELCHEVPGWASTRQTAPDDCVPGSTEREPPPPVTEADLGDGDVQITLRWESAADLDLYVTEPDGTEISFVAPGPTATGGTLDLDANVGCVPEGSVENVSWPAGEMPLGGYRIEVHGYEVEACGSGDYTLTVQLEGQLVLDESGTVGEGDHDAYEFVAA